MDRERSQWLLRGMAGGVLGVAAHVVLGWLNLTGPTYFDGFLFFDCGIEPEGVGVALSFALWFLFGAQLGVATLPFAHSGGALVARSALHFAATAATVGLWAGLNFGVQNVDEFLIPLILAYLLVWLGRWVGWHAELAAIREKLGLDPGPSLLHWRETMPYLAFALLMCDALPLLLRLVDARDVPVLTGLLLPYLLLPVGGFCSGLSLGKRAGFCPLYPLACGLFYLPIIWLLFNSSALFHCAVVLCAALLGNLAGAALRSRQRSGPPAGK